MALTWNQREVIQSSFREVYTSCSSTWKSVCIVITELKVSGGTFWCIRTQQTTSHDEHIYNIFEVILLCNNCFVLWVLTHPFDMWVNPIEMFFLIILLPPTSSSFLKMSVPLNIAVLGEQIAAHSFFERDNNQSTSRRTWCPLFSAWDQNGGREFWKL